MKINNVMRTSSLLSIVLVSLHLSDDIVRGFEPGGLKNILGILILVLWLYGTLVLDERRSGKVIVLLGGLMGSAIPIIHMTGEGLVGGKVQNSAGIFFWVWTNLALGVTSTFCVLLAGRGLRER